MDEESGLLDQERRTESPPPETAEQSLDLRALAFDPARDDVPVPPAQLAQLSDASLGGTVAGRLVRDGIRLFGWRSYLPLLLLLPAALAVRDRLVLGPAWPNIPAGTWLALCAVIAISGQIIRAVTVGRVPDGTCGRNINHLRASSLNTTGLYSVVRNPLYLGNFVIILAFSMAFRVPWFSLIVALLYWVYIDRIIAVEEHYLQLRFGERYRSWARRVPVLLPNPLLWVPSELRFCWRTAARREYNGAFLVLNFFLLARLGEVLFFEKRSASLWWASEGLAWAVGWAIGLLAFTTLRFLKRRTRVLHVAGR
jgi:protein-S-isoprenylcysteine O-methyltransferase Ste14